MHADMVREAWRHRPFRPFVISLSSGETLRIAHPETLVVGRFSAVWIEPETDRTVLIDLTSVAKIELEAIVARRGKGE